MSWDSQEMTRNVISFGHQLRDDLGVHEAVPRIDGIPLTELIDRVRDRRQDATRR
ncbi:hypothetical protein [Streptomyces sclerotialus]|uniref:hypothetical protein n=1 Tax=Streptomyces sclerotialus TaxID=1957 RepID=UPI000A99AB69